MTTEQKSIRTVGIIGAGVMGRGIAAANLRAGRRVRIVDTDAAASAAAVDALLAMYPSIRRPHASRIPDAADISIARGDADMAEVDLIIEAVPEDIALKTAVLSRIEPSLRPDIIVASNSSSIPVSRLASALQEPGRFCALHFCHPVGERPLVEVVGADTTSARTLSGALAYATSLGMAPIIVGDSPGFLLNRLLVPYMNEALELLLDGADVATLDRAATAFGMPIGPLALFDEFGIDVALAVGCSLIRAFPERMVPSELLVAMYKSGRLGRKSGGGFYATEHDAKISRLDPDVAKMISYRQRTGTGPDDDVVMQRLFLPMLLEATRALDEALVAGPAIIDAALRDGLGLTDRECGLFTWANSIGAAAIVDWLRPLQSLGNRFEPTASLLHAAADGIGIGQQRNAAAA